MKKLLEILLWVCVILVIIAGVFMVFNMIYKVITTLPFASPFWYCGVGGIFDEN